jgi:hypothetical protein
MDQPARVVSLTKKGLWKGRIKMVSKGVLIFTFILMALLGLWGMDWDAQAFLLCIGIVAVFVVFGAIIIYKEA